jgi:hypothetical protein
MTETADASPDWLTVGAEVVVLQPYPRAALCAVPTTVDRILKRDVVLANGERFNKERLTRENGAWGTTYYLVPPTDPRVAETRAVIRSRRLRATAETAYEQWRRGKGSAAEVVTAFEAVAQDEGGRE